MQQNKTWKKRVAICGLLPAMLGTAILGCGLLSTNAPVSVVAEDTTSTSHTYTLCEQIAKVGYTEEELSTSGWNGEATNNANRKALLQKAVEKSDLKYYAFAGSSTDYKTWEYYQWAGDGSGYFFNWTNINSIYVWSKSTEYGLNAYGTHGIGGSGNYNQAWVVGWTAPADGVLTIPEHTLTVKSFSSYVEKDTGVLCEATALHLGWTMGKYITPFDSNPTWTTYTATGDYTIAKQTYAVSAGDTVYLNMYSDRTEGSARTTIGYNPTFIFEEKEIEKTTLGAEIGKITYTDEELTATEMTLTKGVLGGATNGLSAENLAKKETFYKTAFGRSDLKFYAGHTDSYTKTEYWERAVDKNNSYRYSWTTINGLSAGHNGTTDPRLEASGSHRVYHNFVWGFGWVAPTDGVLTIPTHTLNLKSSNPFSLGISKDDGSRTAMKPSDTTLNWVRYTKLAQYDILGNSYEVKAGDTVYIVIYAETDVAYIDYNPTFLFASSIVGEVAGNTVTAEEDLGLNFYVDIANADSATATMQMDGEAAETVDGVYDEAKALWRFTYPVAAKDYEKTVNFVLTSVNGEAVTTGVTDSYSVKAYTEAIAAGEYSESAKTLAASIATYCESAKVYFDETAAALAEKVTGEVVAKADLTASKASLTGESDGNVTAVLGATLALEYKTMIHVYFTATDASAIVGAEAVAGADNLYVLKVAVVAKDLGKAQTITIGGYTLTYSAYSYIEATVDNADAALYNVLQALYDYSENAKAYLG